MQSSAAVMRTERTVRVISFNPWEYLLPALSGWLLSRSCPPHALTPTIWIALVPLFIFLSRCQTPARALRGSWLAGAIYYGIILRPFLTLIWWGWADTTAEYNASLRQQYVFLRIWYPLALLWSGAWWGLWGGSLVALARSRRVRVWLAPALWILLCEYLRSRTFFDFTWGYLGYALHPYAGLRQLAAVTGVMGLSALIVLLNAWIAHALLSSWELVRPATPSIVSLQPGREVGLTLSVLLAALASWGTGVLAERPSTVESAKATISVAALQAGVRHYTKEELTSGSLDWKYTPMLQSVLDHGAELVVLPESVWLARLTLDATPTQNSLSRPVLPSDVQAFLSPRLASTGAVVLADFEVAQQGKLYNSIVGWDANGMLGRYDKRRLTPFAEYPPGPFARIAPRNRITYTPGHGSHLFSVHGVRVGSFICQEVQFPYVIRESVRDGAQLLVSTGNDGIFTDPAAAAGHHVAALFRAIETHRPLVRVMKTGISSIIDARGHILSLSALNQPAILQEQLRPSEDLTLYTRWGDWPVALAAFVVLLACLARCRALTSSPTIH